MVADCPAEHSNRYFPVVRPFRNVNHKPNSTHAPTNQPTSHPTKHIDDDHMMMVMLLLRWTMLQFMWQDLLESDPDTEHRTHHTKHWSAIRCFTGFYQIAECSRGDHVKFEQTTNYGKRILACRRTTLSVHIFWLLVGWEIHRCKQNHCAVNIDDEM